MIENKNIGESLDKENQENYEKYLNQKYSNASLEDKELAYSEFHKKDKELDSAFEEQVKVVYNCDKNILDTAYELSDMSDNGTSYSEVENYIIVLLNFLERRKGTDEIKE
jgi:hypothetical protein